MSAYALPGLFPVLPLDGKKIGTRYDGLLCQTNASCKEEKVEYDSRILREASVHVRTARIDALELVKSLTAKRRTKGSRVNRSKSKKEIPNALPEDIAMRFELSITFKGRTYNAVRSLASIRQLHQELVEEAEFYEKEHKANPILSFPPSHAYKRRIPDLPEFQDGANTTNFCLLQAMLLQFAPSLEAWLNKVLAVVSPRDSPCMTYFLCEPMLQTVPVVPKRERNTRSRSAPARLERIVEEKAEEE